ncbi:MAG TPA: SIS domain-containing protein [Pseudacidobacterium sp.]|nr:SIS domain-containing protein [Pseudacidobacterium sp.]
MTEKKDRPRWIGGVEPPSELLAMNGAQILEYECREQPAKLRDLIAAYKDDPDIQDQLRTMREIAARSSAPVIFIGMGGSLCASISASIHLQSHGRPAFSVDAGEWLHYAQPVWKEASISVLVTASGESAELVEFMRQDSGHPMGVICNNQRSPCWERAACRLPILAGPEYGNATKTYTNSTAAGSILASEILAHEWKSNADQAADAVAKSISDSFAMRERMEEFCRGAQNIEVIGRGGGYGAAWMGALTIREMTGFRAAAHTGAGFKHGPNLDTNDTHVAIIFAVGRTAALGRKLAAECNRKGGRVVLVANDTIEPAEKLLPVRIDPVVEPWEGITMLPVVQALTLAWIERNGCNLPPRFAYGVMEQ